ncbi:MAG: hypothetical protein LWW86_03255 [Micrococcales bacterium]|nr:hypothetical protein [Micrococcales bacterium]
MVTAYGIREILDVLEQVAGPPARVVAVGGGTQGGLWTQIVSDVCGIEQVVPRTTVGASYGDALLAAIGVGAVVPQTDWARSGHVVEPVAEHRPTYDRLYAGYRELYPATLGVTHALASLREEGS